MILLARKFKYFVKIKYFFFLLYFVRKKNIGIFAAVCNTLRFIIFATFSIFSLDIGCELR